MSVRALVAGRLDAVVDDLAALVGVETPSTDPALLARGTAEFVAWVSQRWREAAVTTLGDGPDAVIQVDVPGELPGTVVLLGHLDTVFEAGTLARRPFTVTDGIARGPGVFDMKAGLVQGVHAVAALDELGVPRPSVRLLVNADEEVGSNGSRAALLAASSGARSVLVLEPGGVAGTVKTARKGVGLWTVTATGVAAHAGLDPEAGASAVHALAALTTHLVGLADPSRGTTVNVGVLTGGTRPNVTAEHARLEIDVRARTEADAARVGTRSRRGGRTTTGCVWRSPAGGTARRGPTRRPTSSRWPGRSWRPSASRSIRARSAAPATATSSRRPGCRCWTVWAPAAAVRTPSTSTSSSATSRSVSPCSRAWSPERRPPPDRP